ncbi:MAG: hypothetical protein GF411_13025 [Candidatus Lokiarchaeota archaeon]|nr:hypothetical protein [Candidatus Lokiarchaeota archaeon]
MKLFRILLMVALIGIIPSLPLQNHSVQLAITNMPIPSEMVSHSPILIGNNSDFSAQSFPGTGTESDPYIINGLEILSAGEPCIQIANVSVYFEIVDCILSGTREIGGAITITNLESEVSGTISSCEVYNSTIGIYVEANNFTIKQNQVRNCSFSDVLLEGNHISFTSNTVTTNGTYSLIWESSEYGVIKDNVIESVPHTASYQEVLLQDVHNFSITDNTFIRARMSLVGSDLLCSHNTFYTSRHVTLEVENSENVTVENCEFERRFLFEDYFSQFLVTKSTNITIIGCTSNIRIALASCENITISESELFLEGISFNDVQGYLNITRNHIGYGLYGIDAGAVTNCSAVISENLISGFSKGIYVVGSNITIKNNTITNNQLGIETRHSGNEIYYNTFTDNLNHAWDLSENIWDDQSSLGNFWDSYFTVDDHYPVYLDNDAPLINPISDISVASGSNLSLVVSAMDNTPFLYLVRINGEVFDSGSWNGSDIVITLQNLNLTEYDIRIVLTDINGNAGVETVLVRVYTPFVFPIVLVFALGTGILAITAFIVFMKSKD